jgi:hypothetical protein
MAAGSIARVNGVLNAANQPLFSPLGRDTLGGDPSDGGQPGGLRLEVVGQRRPERPRFYRQISTPAALRGLLAPAAVSRSCDSFHIPQGPRRRPVPRRLDIAPLRADRCGASCTAAHAQDLPMFSASPL